MTGTVPSRLVEAYQLTPTEVGRTEAFDACLLEAADHTNLVSRSTIADRWSRHHEDSLQLFPLVPARDTIRLLDVGSGAGFPGLLLAILMQDRRPRDTIVLCESVGKKAAFLNAAVEAAGLTNVSVTNQRVEALSTTFDVVTARAVASLDKLLSLTVPRLAKGGSIILPKGRNAVAELEEATSRWRLQVERVSSTTDPDATILVITDPERRS